MLQMLVDEDDEQDDDDDDDGEMQFLSFEDMNSLGSKTSLVSYHRPKNVTGQR